MPITSTEITLFSRDRYVIEFTTGSGEKLHRRIIGSPLNRDDALTHALTLVPQVEKNIQERDATKAVDKGLVTAYGEASENQVIYAWLKYGYYEEEHYKAYTALKNIAPDILSLGYTDEQYAGAFNTTVEEVQNIKEYWSFLDANSVSIDAYNTINEGRV